MTIHNLHKKILIGLTLTVLAVGLGGIGYLYFFPSMPVKKTPPDEQARPSKKLMTSIDAYALAESKAKEWRTDAVLAAQNSAPAQTSTDGQAGEWELIFVSDAKKGIGYKVTIADKSVRSAEEIPFYGQGGVPPADSLTAEQAIEKVLKIKGYENEKIISVEMIYGPDGSQWYWGVKTAKGTVTIKAAK
jgi:hypothetical protein